MYGSRMLSLTFGSCARLLALAIVSSLLTMQAHCSDEVTQSEPTNPYAAMFEGLPAASHDVPLVLAAPQGGEAYHVGDTLTVVFKRDDPSMICTSIHLSPDSGLTLGWVAYEAPIGAGFGDSIGLGLAPVVHELYGDIHVVKWEISDSTRAYPGYYTSLNIGTHGEHCVVRLADDVGDCGGSVSPVYSGTFSIVGG